MASKHSNKSRGHASRQAKQSSDKHIGKTVEPEPAVQSGLDSGSAIDFEKLATVGNVELNLTCFPTPAVVSPTSQESDHAVFEELANDMLGLMQQVKALQDHLSSVMSRVEQVEKRVVGITNSQIHEFDILKRELLGDRKAMAARTTLNAVAPWMDSLREMRNRMTSQKDAKLYSQVDAIIDRTVMMLHVLGFEEFCVGEGEVFDPIRMECVGYAEGKSGVVLKAKRPGYCAGGTIIRPAGVIIADPRSTPPVLPQSVPSY